MDGDLAEVHRPIGGLFDWPRSAAEWDRYRLTDEQVRSFHEQGYLAGVRILDDRQADTLREELARLMDPGHPRHRLFYEFHSNESVKAESVLFHALGAWRIEPGFHD